MASGAWRSDEGQASVELVAMLPVVLLVGAVCWQAALAGHAVWMSAHAARVAARADAVGRDPERAARSALPAALRRGLSVRRLREGGVRVRVGIPFLLAHRRALATVTATASLGRGDR